MTNVTSRHWATGLPIFDRLSADTLISPSKLPLKSGKAYQPAHALSLMRFTIVPRPLKLVLYEC